MDAIWRKAGEGISGLRDDQRGLEDRVSLLEARWREDQEKIVKLTNIVSKLNIKLKALGQRVS